MSILKILKPIGALVSYLHYKTDRFRLQRLMERGLKIGRNSYIMEGVEFDTLYPYLIEIGNDCRIGKGVRILAHDSGLFHDLGINRILPVKILDGSFIGERAIILPGITIGPKAIIAAGSVVTQDVGSDQVAAGNPAKPIGTYSGTVEKLRKLAMAGTVLQKKDIEEGIITPMEIARILSTKHIAFVKGIPNKDPYYVNANIEEMRKRAVSNYNKLMEEVD
jgi:maltose O-acetyltransferase